MEEGTTSELRSPAVPPSKPPTFLGTLGTGHCFARSCRARACFSRFVCVGYALSGLSCGGVSRVLFVWGFTLLVLSGRVLLFLVQVIKKGGLFGASFSTTDLQALDIRRCTPIRGTTMKCGIHRTTYH